MIDDLKSKVAKLIENGAIDTQSAHIVSKVSSHITTGELLGNITGEMDPDLTFKTYKRRKKKLDDAGQIYFGLDELLATLKKIERPVRALQIHSSLYKLVIFVDSEISSIVGLVAIEN